MGAAVWVSKASAVMGFRWVGAQMHQWKGLGVCLFSIPTYSIETQFQECSDCLS